ncbi:MAG: hypothetical protein A3B44_02445 [Candidatus Levybacteria bacterium RIFCSPLOWO2_01_FULL_38_21]|nr:MAG: hypothetical protein A3B44_02445 [Candidatus Levybacteria bacterium RIFCSPLOWO2_01_FULL_38_21]
MGQFFNKNVIDMEEEKQTASNELFELPDTIIREKKLKFNLKFPQFTNGFNFQNLKFNKKNMIQYLLIAAVIVVVLIAGISIINKIVSMQQSSSLVGGKSGEIKIAGPVVTQKLNKEFKFSLRDEKGKEISKFTYSVESAELRKEILVKGQKATAIKGRIFLIINLKIVNTLKQGINVNAKDYMRLTVNRNNNELLAPDIHNDPVEVQAISTKYTRVGYAINESNYDYTLHVGEIDGKKETIKLNIK